MQNGLLGADIYSACGGPDLRYERDENTGRVTQPAGNNVFCINITAYLREKKRVRVPI